MKSKLRLLIGSLTLTACADPVSAPVLPEASSFAKAASGFLVKDLGSPTSGLGADDAGSIARAVNKSGVIVGTAATRKYEPGSYTHAMRWTIDAAGNVQMEDLMPRMGLATTADASPSGINDLGIIVGGFRASDNDTYLHAFVLEPSGMTALHDLQPCTGSPLEANYSHANDINNRDEIVGVRAMVGAAYRAFFLSLRDGCIVELPSLGAHAEARSINDASVITGWSIDQTGKRAVVWTRSTDGGWTIRSLGPEGAEAWDINSQGEVAGEQWRPNGGSLADQFAFAWLGPDAGTPTSVGTLGGLQSAAFGISESGMIVGWAHNKQQIYRPFLWTPAEMRDLGTLGGPRGTAYAINGQWIVGNSEIFTKGRTIMGHATLWKVP